MTPKEKAQELLIKMWTKSSVRLEAKECALIAVNEVVKQYIETHNNIKQLHPHVFVRDYDETEKYQFWQKVKQEIELL